MGEVPIAELEARLASVSDPIARVDALNALAWEMRFQDAKRANALAAEARGLAIVHAYTLGQARAARTLAMAVIDDEGLRAVFPLAEEARRLFDEADDGHGRAASRDFLASLHEYVGDLSTGLELALDALAIAREVNAPIRQGYALSSVGGILATSGEIDAAVEHLEEALGLFEAAGDVRGTGTIRYRLATILDGAGRRDEALAHAKKCCEAADTVGEGGMRADALATMASIEEGRGRLEEAEALYRSALDGAFASTPGRNLIGSPKQIALGRLLMKRGALDEAERELEDALSRVEDDSFSLGTEAAAHEALAELCERRGNLERAMQHLRSAQALKERLAQHDAKNKLTQMEARAAMVAARKDAEIHKLRYVELVGMQAKLVEAEKMALLGRLAAGTAHELNTPLGALRSNAELAATAIDRVVSLMRETNIGDRALKLASVLESSRQTSEEALERIAAIARSFARFAELDQAERRAFDVRAGLDGALALIEPSTPKVIAFVRSFEEIARIEGWPRELSHAFMTLLQNAAQSIDGEGVVTVETRETADDVLVRVRDTGRGMTDEEATHLFDVAWSERGDRTHMRLGLSAVYTTMQKHGGTVEVESALGKGTVVTLRLPKHTEP